VRAKWLDEEGGVDGGEGVASGVVVWM
jgi:hypothetical protein